MLELCETKLRKKACNSIKITCFFCCKYY